ncbi:TPA: hypothetical protein ACH3X1_009638 [Trebouxia sp. C0004]
MLPKEKPSNAPLPCVLFQARYTRGVQLRFPFRLMTDGRPYDFINIGFKAEALLEGYAVISMDFRGTAFETLYLLFTALNIVLLKCFGVQGASFGQWRLPWGAVERHDSIAVLDWMTGQPWCNGKVVLCGQSYDATAALFTTSMQHPAVKGCVALYPFWDLYHDIAIPGGIAMKSFSEAWALFCKGMDYNDYSLLQSPAKQLLSAICKGCNPVINYDGARCTARSFADMTKGTRLLLHRLTHSTKMLTLGSNQAMLASQAAPSRRSIQGTAAAPSAAGIAGTPQQQTDSSGAEALPPTNQPAVPTGTSQQASTSGMERQLSLDTAKDQHSYRSWNRVGLQHQGMGPMVNAQTIPARGANTEGISASWLHISVRRHYKEKGKRLLAAAVAEHDTWDSAAAMKTIRFTDQQASQTKATTSDASLCSRADELRQANVPLQLVSGWLDSTAAAAINLYHYCGQAPGSELVLGPWSHGGIVDQSVGKDSSFDQPKNSMAFINRCCDHTPSSKSASVTDQPHSQNPLQPLQADAHANGSTSQNDEDRRQAWLPHTLAAGDLVGGRTGQNSCSKEDKDAASPSVHFFMMGCKSRRGWQGCHSWPPPNTTSPPLKLYLSKAAGPAMKKTRSWFWSSKKKIELPVVEPTRVADSEISQQPAGTHHHQKPPPSEGIKQQHMSSQESISSDGHNQRQQAGECERCAEALNPAPVSAQQDKTQLTQIVTSKKHPQPGQLSQSPAQQNYRFRHDISLDKHPKGLSRYEAISKITKSMHYDNLGKCGHLVFTGPALPAATQVVGSVGLEVWVESSGHELDLFAYLQDVDTDGNISYVTEGMFRVSHRKEYPAPPNGDSRAKASLPGEPFHSFSQRDAQETPAGAAVRCRFQLMPTAYCFAQGHSMRLAFSGGDAKHFYVDHLNIKTMWVHSGPGRQSAIHIYVTNQ